MNQTAKIGIWGLGTVGRSAIEYFISQNFTHLIAMDSMQPPPEVASLLAHYNIPFYYQQTQQDHFFSSSDFILPSPGIDTHPYQKHQHKWLTETDLFASKWHKPMIAITGTLGKTTITTLLAHELQARGLRVAVGGNIGTPMLSLIKDQEGKDVAVLELSSFQLEYTQTFAPDLAIITNLYPNHLDRHDDLASYWQAKKNIFARQRSGQHLLLPLNLKDNISQHAATITYFSDHHPLAPQESICYFFDHEGNIQKQCGPTEPAQLVLERAGIPKSSFAMNWLLVAAALERYGLYARHLSGDSSALHHRLEFVGIKDGIEFYNDSKATVMEATLSAVQAHKNKPVILLLGGLSKGVNRAEYIEKLNGIKHVMCFGAEAKALHTMCTAHSIPANTYSTLEECFEHLPALAQTGDVVLLSPGGSSYDLYKNYQERGGHFRFLYEKYKSAKLNACKPKVTLYGGENL